MCGIRLEADRKSARGPRKLRHVNHRGVFNRARCYFKAIDGTIADSFDVIALEAAAPRSASSIAPWRLALRPLEASVLKVFVVRLRMAGRRGALKDGSNIVMGSSVG